jgi:hypothetical protein
VTAVGKGSAAKPRATPRPRPAARPQLTVEPDDGAFPVLRLKTTANGHAAKRVPLFSIDDTEFTMLAEPPASLALRFLRRQQRDGADAGFEFAMEHMVGPDAYDALLNYEPLTRDQFAQVSKVVIDTLLGALETPKDSSESGSPRSAG